MTRLPVPPDLDPDEEPISELSVLIPESDAAFAEETRSRLDQQALARDVGVATVWSVLAAIIQLLTAACALFGVKEAEDSHQEDDNA